MSEVHCEQSAAARCEQSAAARCEQSAAARCEQSAADELFKQFSREFAALSTRRPIILRLTAIQAWCLFAALQIALRHPGCTGPTANIVTAVAHGLEARVATTPALQEVARWGWDSAPSEARQPAASQARQHAASTARQPDLDPEYLQ